MADMECIRGGIRGGKGIKYRDTGYRYTQEIYAGQGKYNGVRST